MLYMKAGKIIYLIELFVAFAMAAIIFLCLYWLSYITIYTTVRGG